MLLTTQRMNPPPSSIMRMFTGCGDKQRFKASLVTKVLNQNLLFGMPGGWGSPMDPSTTEWLDDWQRVAPCQVSACQNLPRYLSKDYVGLESQITMIP